MAGLLSTGPQVSSSKVLKQVKCQVKIAKVCHQNEQQRERRHIHTQAGELKEDLERKVSNLERKLKMYQKIDNIG